MNVPIDEVVWPLSVFVWFDTGDGVDGPMEGLLLKPPKDGVADVEVLDPEFIESYGRPGEKYLVTADKLPASGRVGRDRFCWSLTPMRKHGAGG